MLRQSSFIPVLHITLNSSHLTRHTCAGNSLWVAVLWCCVNSPFLPRGRSWSVRILQLAFGFFCVVVVNTYTASLASLLTVQNLSTPITSLLDLLRA